MTFGETSTGWLELCGRPRPTGYWYRNWPKVICTLPLGHECDHEFARPDGVSYVWPYSPDELEGRGRG